MFTWICPKCGREVPPAYTDCPDCNPQTAPASAPPPLQRPYAAPPPAPAGPAQRRPIWQSAPPQPPQQPYAAPPPPQQPYAAPPPPPEPPRAYAPPAPEPQASPWDAPPPPPRGIALPTWLLAIVFTLAFGGLVLGVYWLVGSHGSSGATQTSSAVDIPVPAPGAKANPYQKFIEISGIRFAEDPKNKDKSIVKFVITNHADDEIAGLSGSVAIVGRGDKSGQAVAGFSFTTTLGPEESKDLTTSLTTKLKAYELPDWQFAQPMLQITGPGGASAGSQ
jgi:hypothetical protein